jgi:hypothetical protein
MIQYLFRQFTAKFVFLITEIDPIDKEAIFFTDNLSIVEHHK